MTGDAARRADTVNLPFVAADDLRDRADRASARLDNLFRLSTLVHELRVDTEHPVVWAAFGMVHDRLSELIAEGLAVAEHARDAALSGALTGAPPDSDEVNRLELTRDDLRARVDRAGVRCDAARRLVDLAGELADTTGDPAERSAWWRVLDQALEETTHAGSVSDRAWQAYAARGDQPAGHGPDADPPSASGADPDGLSPDAYTERPDGTG